MGQVYLAIDERLGRKVALKVLHSDIGETPQWRARMMREAETVSALNHPGLLTLYDLGTHEGHLFLVFEFVDGESLTSIAKRGIPPHEAALLIADVADALAAAHATGILHRDIKCDNVILSKSGRAKVLDFGLAKLGVAGDSVSEPTTAGSANVTRVGEIIGTPSYMAPEQLEGAPPTVQTETFALGVALYELLAGKGPFLKESLLYTLTAVKECKPEPPSVLAPDRDIPGALDEVVLKALDRDPSKRFLDMRSFAKELRAVVRRARERKFWAAAVIAFVVLAGSTSAWLLTRDEGPKVHGAARRITFDPGCAGAPVYTPDGRAVVYDTNFDGDYDVTELDLATNARRKITTQQGWDYSASVSPDGKWIGYLRQDEDNAVRVLPMSGEGEPLSIGPFHGYPYFGQNGLLYHSSAERVLEWDPKTKAIKERASLPKDFFALHMAPFADGTIYAVVSSFVRDAPPTLARIEGSAVTILSVPELIAAPIAASPSGKELYYNRRGPTGTELVRAPRDALDQPKIIASGLSGAGGYGFAPNGKQLVFSTCKMTTYLARIKDGVKKPLTRVRDWNDDDPRRLDARRIVFSSDRGGGGMQVWSLDVQTGASNAITPLNTTRAAVSVDGKTIAWAGMDPPGIFVAKLGDDGRIAGETTRLTSVEGDTTPQLSHDGAFVLFVRHDKDGDRVYSVPVSGGEQRPVTPNRVTYAAVSPVKDEIVYLNATDDAPAELIAIDRARTSERKVVTLKAGAYYKAPRFSPDGTRVLLVREDQEIVEIDLTTKKQTLLWPARGSDSANSAEYAPDGDGIIAALGLWEGDLWLLDGEF